MNNLRDQDDERNRDWLDALFFRDMQVDSDPVLISKVMSRIHADVLDARGHQTVNFQVSRNVLFFGGPYLIVGGALLALILMLPEFTHVLLRLAWDPLSKTTWFDGTLWAGIACMSLLVIGGMQTSKLRLTEFGFDIDWSSSV